MVPPPSNPPPNPQQVQQFLSSVLSQRGPSALPYAENTKWLIRQHLLNLVAGYPSLEPKTATFTHNDGRSINLLQADGTVPMPFQGVTYNIPVVIWLLESYPRHAPCVYVNPTRDMIIKRPHPHVTPSGLVAVPYLQNWVYPSSNLVDLAAELSAVFSRDPPLYAQRRPPLPSPSPSYSSSSSIGSGYGSSAAAVHARPPVDPPPPRPYPPSPYVGSGRVQPQQHHHLQQYHHHHHQQTDDAADVFKRNSMNKIVETVHADLSAMRRSREAEAEGLLSAQAELKRREEQINKGLKEMQDEKESLEQQLQVMSMNTDILDSWVKENERKTKNLHDLDVDSAFECVDTLSKQMLECTALDLAIEDAVYSLDKAVQEGAVPFDQYLRNVRFLSREQFFHRATTAKVRATQMEAQVAAIAARLHS